MKQFIIYNTTTGQFDQTFQNTLGVMPNLTIGDDQAILEIDNPQEFYEGNQYYIDVTTNEIVSRPKVEDIHSWNKLTIVADGVDEAILGNDLPSDMVVQIIPMTGGTSETQSITTTDGSFEFASVLIGEYVAMINHFPYQAYKTRIKAE